MKRKYLLRWRYDYAGGTHKYGLWCHPGTSETDYAWSNNKEGVVSASIEAKNFDTREIRRVVECKGEDFVNFQWIAQAFPKPFGGGTQTPLTKLVGLKMMTRDTKYETYIDGTLNKTAMTAGDKSLNFATFGK